MDHARLASVLHRNRRDFAQLSRIVTSMLPNCLRVPLCPLWLMVLLFRGFLDANDAAKSLVAGSGIHLLRDARRRTIAQTVVGRAQVRAALQNFTRDADLRRSRIIAFLFRDSFDATRAAWL